MFAPKTFPWHQPVDCLKRITHRQKRRQPIINIEESQLPRRQSLKNYAIKQQTRTGPTDMPFFEVPFYCGYCRL
jgi:hypothetical protein